MPFLAQFELIVSATAKSIRLPVIGFYQLNVNSLSATTNAVAFSVLAKFRIQSLRQFVDYV